MRSKKSKKSIHILYILLALILFIGILLYTRQPISSGLSTSFAIDKIIRVLGDIIPGENHMPEFIRNTDLNFIVRKATHVIIYAVFALFIWKVLQPRRFRYITAWCAVTLIAILDEWHQTFIAWRAGHVGDVILDSLAAFSMLFIIYIYRKNQN